MFLLSFDSWSGKGLFEITAVTMLTSAVGGCVRNIANQEHDTRFSHLHLYLGNPKHSGCPTSFGSSYCSSMGLRSTS